MVTIARRRPATASPEMRHTTSRMRSRVSDVITKEELFAAVHKHLMTTSMVSELTGLPNRTISIYHGRGTMPKPEMYLGQTPLWHRDTVVEWENTRPKRTQNTAK